VVSSDGFINCGSTCSHDYNVYTQVTLTALDSGGWIFSSWSGCDQVLYNECYVTLYSKRSVTATYTQGVYTLYVSHGGTGSGSVASSDGYINCGSTCQQEYLGGTVVTLTANPAQGSRFDGWSGCSNVQNNVCAITIAGDEYVAAAFNLIGHYRLSVQKWGSGVGTITSSDGHIAALPALTITIPATV
jgi:hypothetical protein